MTLQQTCICVIKGCGKKGSFRLIDSYDERYGWFCKDHWFELYNHNYPDLLGEGYKITISDRGYSCIACYYCSHGNPCDTCVYMKVNNERWYFQRRGEKVSPPRWFMDINQETKEELK